LNLDVHEIHMMFIHFLIFLVFDLKMMEREKEMVFMVCGCQCIEISEQSLTINATTYTV